MKNAIRVVVLIGILLMVLMSCTMDIDLWWQIGILATDGAGGTIIPYTVQNMGNYDLTNVTLKIQLYNGSYYVAWTPKVSISKGSTLITSIDFVGVPYVPGTSTASVIEVGMDKPN
jgi:hypothetical protein